MMWLFGRKGPSGFSSSSTAEEVTSGIDCSGLTAIVTGHFLLTNLLLDTMRKTACATKREARIVNVSSDAHQRPYKEGIHFDRLNDGQGYSRWLAYG